MSVDERSKPMANDTPLSRLPDLAEAVITKNLLYEIEKLKAAPSFQQKTGRSSETLAKYPDFRIVLMLMKAGTTIAKHHADGRISVHVVQGKIRMHVLQGQSVDLNAGELLTLDRGLEHDVEAIEESAFLLTIT